MGKVYSAPKELNKPELKPGQDWHEYDRLETEYEARIVAWAKKNGSDPEAGEEVRFPMADGYARYIILSLKPVKLIHVDTGDAWHFQYSNRVTATDLRRQISSAKAMRELFAKKKADKDTCIDKIITEAGT